MAPVSPQGPSGNGFQARLARLRAAFLDQLPGRLAGATADLATARAGIADWTGTARPALARLGLALHTLKGSSGSFGLNDLHDQAVAADAAVTAMLGDDAPPPPVRWAELEALLARLSAIGALPETADAGTRFGFEPLSAGTPLAPAPTAPPDAPRRERRVIVCDDDADVAAQLANQLTCFGYRTTALASLGALAGAVRAEPPDAVVMDVIFPEGEQAGPTTLAALIRELGRPIPSIYVSCRDDFDARLWAVKAGGSAYCPKPVRVTELVEVLDAIANPNPALPFHVLVVDDDQQTGALHALILEEAGMTTAVANNPRQVPDLLKGFKADLVLMDLHMPECSGPELARVLRQMPGHLSLPIIYLSSETDLGRQLQALEVGAEGFMTKPVDPARLIAEVTLRAERMRTLHGLMVRDGLTGLFNHNTILQFLEISVANARRDGRALSVAMIDVDRFKQVNDTYGHPAGDQVLLALSRGLRMRLRDCDIVGRYGGEEFAAVLVGADADTAWRLIDQLRLSFGAVQFFAGEHAFRCTFSAGVAALPDFANADALIQAADAALYRAKRGGRDRVEIARVANGVGR